MTEHPNAALIREAFDYMTSGDADKLSALIADNIVFHQIGLPPINGKEALRESFAGFDEIDFDSELHDVVANDDHTIALATTTIKAGDEEFTYRTAEIYHVEDGKISERWAFSDDTEAINNFFGQLAG